MTWLLREVIRTVSLIFIFSTLPDLPGNFISMMTELQYSCLNRILRFNRSLNQQLVLSDLLLPLPTVQNIILEKQAIMELLSPSNRQRRPLFNMAYQMPMPLHLPGS